MRLTALNLTFSDSLSQEYNFSDVEDIFSNSFKMHAPFLNVKVKFTELLTLFFSMEAGESPFAQLNLRNAVKAKPQKTPERRSAK